MTRLLPSGRGAASPAHVDAVVALGFTERQARFLTLVMRHSGICVPRQYAQVAGIAQGAKCNAFFERLVRGGHARAIECVHNRARLYLVHSKLLYHTIGEPTSRYRRPVSPRLALERLMLLDAVLSTPASGWLATPAERAAVFPPAAASTKLSDEFPVGLDADDRVVILYLALEPWPDAFRTFLRNHAPLLDALPRWTLRVVMPRGMARAHDAYQRAVHEELESTLSASTIADLKRYFECRRNLHTTADPNADDIFRTGHRRFSTPRFNELYRRWNKQGDEVFNTASSTALAEALETGAGRVESFVLPHGYQHLSPLVGESRSTPAEVEKGVEEIDHRGDIDRQHSQPRPSTPRPSRERTVVM